MPSITQSHLKLRASGSRRAKRITSARAWLLRHARAVVVCGYVAAIALALVLTSPAVAGAQTDLTYGGLSSQRMPVYLELSRTGRAVRRTYLPLELACRSGDRFVIVDDYMGLAISGAGRFATSFRDGPRQEGNTQVQASGSIAGRFDRQRLIARGTWSMTLSTRESTGQTDTCSARVPFTAYR